MGGEVTESIGKITGTALEPGVSLNGRLYTVDLIKKATERMSARISDPNGLPIPMRSHHQAGDDPTKIAAVITGIKLDEMGRAKYTAELQDTAAGREIASLTSTKEGNAPALRSVSIHGYWVGSPRAAKYEGKTVETADDMEIDAIDFTAFPGVTGARIEHSALGESTDGRTAITESAEAYVTTDARGSSVSEAKYDADQMKAMLSKGHAMKNDSGDPSYPIADVADLKKAIKAVGRGKAGHDAIRKHVMKRAKALNAMNLIPANWNADGSVKENASPYRFGELREYYPDGPRGDASFCIDVSNGPLSLTMRSYCLDPAELRVIAAAAMDAACTAMEIMDPDGDGDIDVEGAPEADNDDDMGPRLESTEFATGGVVTLEASEALGALIGSGCAYVLPTGAPALESGKAVTLNISGSALAGRDLRELVQEQMARLDGRYKPFAKPEDPAAQTAPESVEEAAMANDTETVTAETTAETTTTEESTVTTPAVSETTDAPAAVTVDMAALGATVAAAVAQALSAHQASLTAAPPVPAPAESAAPAAAVTETAPVAEAAAGTTAALMESLESALLPRIYAQLRADLVKENGLPSRRGYRLTEADDTVRTDEQRGADLWSNRAQEIFGDWGATPTPIPGTGIAQTV